MNEWKKIYCTVSVSYDLQNSTAKTMALTATAYWKMSNHFLLTLKDLIPLKMWHFQWRLQFCWFHYWYKQMLTYVLFFVYFKTADDHTISLKGKEKIAFRSTFVQVTLLSHRYIIPKQCCSAWTIRVHLLKWFVKIILKLRFWILSFSLDLVYKEGTHSAHSTFSKTFGYNKFGKI